MTSNLPPIPDTLINPPISATPTLIQLGRRGLWIFSLIALLLICMWLWLTWNGVRQMQLQRMTVAVSLAANHSQSYLDTVGGHLESLSLLMRQNDALNHPRIAYTLLEDFKAKHGDLGGATLIAPSGQMLVSTAQKPGVRLPNVMENPDWNADFAKNLNATGLSINRPQRGYLLEAWLMPLRYTARDSLQRVEFLIQTSILMERQQALWANLGLQPGAQIGLMREDGVLLSMWPMPGGKFDPKSFQAKTLSQAIQKNSANGFFESIDASWIDHRVGTYQRLRTAPLYAFMSVSNELNLRLWWRTVQLPIYLLLVLFAFGAGAYALLARRFALRMQTIQATLAQGRLSDSVQLPTSGVREIDDLCAALADTQSKLKAAAKNREHQLLSAADAGTYTLRLRDGVLLQADDAFVAMLGRNRDEVVGRAWATLFEQGDGIDGANSGAFPSQELSLRVLRFKHGSGRPVWLSLAEYIDNSEGEPLRQGLAIDVSQREELLAKVQSHSDRLHALWRLATDRDSLDMDKVKQMLRLGLDTLGLEIALIGEVETGLLHVRYLVGNAMLFEEGTSFPVMDSLCHDTLREKRSLFIDNVSTHPVYRTNRMAMQRGVLVYASVPIWVGDQIYGTLVFLGQTLRDQPLSEEDKAFVELLAAWFGKALFEQRQRQMLETMAMTDSLTGLPNRRAADARLSVELARAKRAEEPFTIVICDLDRFKLINDHFGHDVGDGVLQHVGTILHTALRESDWVARWGGEEFILFLHQSTGQEAFNAMERLREEIKARPLVTPHGKLELTASFGIGTYRDSEADITQVLAEADGCLYEAKRRGRDRVMMSEAATKGLLWQAGMLQRALQEQRIVAAYQVMVDLNTGKVVADEALARLIQPDGKVLPAADFVEAAEGINLIHVVDDIIARSALARCCGRRVHDPQDEVVHFINLSPQFLARRDLLDALLADAKLLAERSGMKFASRQPVVFEITERQLLEDFGAMREDLKHLLEYGFRLALDDFGSGYSSFLYLAELPISFIKIEGWMVRNMQYNDRILSMVKSVVMLAKTLGITTIAECVEDARTAEILRDMGVDWAQGYHFGYPALEEKGTSHQIVGS
ncbi:MAG: diguanylate cyclase [Burkholderiales bacterium]|nr:diguanylate cyclase [Burkholderiales bacterium]